MELRFHGLVAASPIIAHVPGDCIDITLSSSFSQSHPYLMAVAIGWLVVAMCTSAVSGWVARGCYAARIEALKLKVRGGGVGVGSGAMIGVTLLNDEFSSQ